MMISGSVTDQPKHPEETETTTAVLSQIHQITELLQDISNTRNTLAQVLKQMQSLLQCDQTAIALFNQTSLTPEMIFPADTEVPDHTSNIWDVRLHLKLFENCQSLIASANDSVNLQPEENTENGYSLILPLQFNNKCFGTLGIEKYDSLGLNQDEHYILQMTVRQIGMALARHYAQTQADFADMRYHQFFHQTNIPLFFCDNTGQLSDYNPAFMDIMGLGSAAKCHEVNFFDRLLISDKHKDTFKRLLGKCGFFQNLETKLRRLDGRLLTVLFTITPVRHNQGKITGFEGIVQDITEKRELEEQLIQAQKIGVLGSLAGGIAHDFNNLISGIMGCASLVKSDMKQNNPHYEDIQTILKASQKAADLTKQLLTFSRKEKNIKESVDVNEIINELLDLLSRTLNKNISISTQLQDPLPTISADPTRIQQALMNICVNARDAMPDGGDLTITTRHLTLKKPPKTRPVIKPGSYICIQIEDTGAGMDELTLAKIFEPFFTTKEAKKGCGLGMAIVSDIMGSHGGGIAVKSTIGQGTGFSIYLPAEMNMQTRETEADKKKMIPEGKETLLIVDDEEIICNMGKRMLEKFGYKVLTAQNGNDAIQKFKNRLSHIDLIILDMIMPKMNGKETLENIKQINPNVKALVTSGYPEESLLDKVRSDGFDGCLRKPFMADQLLGTVRTLLDEQSKN